MEPRVSSPEINKQYIHPNESFEGSKGDLGSAVTKSAEHQKSIREQSTEPDDKLAATSSLSYPENPVKIDDVPVASSEKTQKEIFDNLHVHLGGRSDDDFMNNLDVITEDIFKLNAENRQAAENEMLTS